MVQYTNLLVASAVVAAIPAIAAPFGGVESRELNDVEAREPMFKAIVDIATHAPARRIITEPLKKTAHDAFDQHQNSHHSGPGPAQHAMNKILQEQKARQQQRPRELEDFEEFEAREPMFKAMVDLAAHGPARRVITEPLKKVAHDAFDQHQQPHRSGPGPAQQAMNRILQEQRARQQQRPRDLEDFEEFEAREPMFKAIVDLAAHGPARRVITAPLRQTAHDAYNQHQHPIRAGPGPAQQAMNRILQEQRARQQPRPRDLEAAEEFYAREPMFRAIVDLAAHGPARRVITEPLKKVAHDAFDQHQQPHRSGPGPAQQAMNRILQEQRARQQQRPRDLEELLEREFFDLD